MKAPNLNGPYTLTIGTIERQLGKIVSAGVVAFGSFDQDGSWQVEQVDRSDAHIRARLWANTTSYQYFSYKLCSSAEEAFRLHCELHHKYAPQFAAHPRPPDSDPIPCVICGKRFNL